MTLSVVLGYAECRVYFNVALMCYYAECRYAECRGATLIGLNNKETECIHNKTFCSSNGAALCAWF
jgi:hypothetical protein